MIIFRDLCVFWRSVDGVEAAWYILQESGLEEEKDDNTEESSSLPFDLMQALCCTPIKSNLQNIRYFFFSLYREDSHDLYY